VKTRRQWAQSEIQRFLVELSPQNCKEWVSAVTASWIGSPKFEVFHAFSLGVGSLSLSGYHTGFQIFGDGAIRALTRLEAPL